MFPPTFAALRLCMNSKINNILLGVLAILIGVLYVFHFTKSTGTSAPAAAGTGDSTLIDYKGKIAYFEMDSLEAQYLYIKEVQTKLRGREESINNEINTMRNGYAGRVQQLQQKAPTMSQQEGEAAQAEIGQMERNLQQRQARLTQELQEQQFKLMQDINKKIEDFLTDYNKEKQFAYILSRQAGDFIYYRDTALNITNDLIKGLNELYNKENTSKKDSKKE